MVAIAAGLLAYALWKLALAVLGNGPEGGGGTKLKDRLANLGGGLVYLAFASVAVRVLIGSAGNQTAEQRHAAAGVLGWPGGRWFVGLGGGCLIAISAYQIYAALSDEFAEDNKVAEMDRRPRRLFLVLGRTGLTARALVFALVGYFLVRTAIDFKPSSGLGSTGHWPRCTSYRWVGGCWASSPRACWCSPCSRCSRRATSGCEAQAQLSVRR